MRSFSINTEIFEVHIFRSEDFREFLIDFVLLSRTMDAHAATTIICVE